MTDDTTTPPIVLEGVLTEWEDSDDGRKAYRVGDERLGRVLSELCTGVNEYRRGYFVTTGPRVKITIEVLP